ncbi:hypothetical protein FPOAC1_008458 [Fusarium poae]|uniref:hypothetical protein n=1 Tax=Fusarium poae TaxID=36050 RepID=UPI001CE7E3F7|nr:hypothetical protein FPOAC1_008458 [Fusarium poae]KAG8669071.1 hypothetical protein FPOAC1_008458 [Fusarium poae]
MNEPNYFNVPLGTQAPPSLAPPSLFLSGPKCDNTMRHQPSLPSMPENGLSSPLHSGGTTPRPLNRQSAESPGFGVDPPRPARDGFDKGFFKWRNRSTKSASESDVRDMSLGSALTPLSASPNFQGFEPSQPRPPSSPFVSESAHVFSLQHPSVTRFSDQIQDFSSTSPSVYRDSTDSISPMNNLVPPRTTDTPPSTSSSSESLYGKAKKSIGSKLKFKIRREATPYSAIPEHEHHCSTMDGTRNHTSIHQITKIGSWFKDDVSITKLRQRFFGRSPWGREGSVNSYSSVTSSVREILKVRVNCVDSPYPGGEARRIKTPPLTEGTASGRPRSFFAETVAHADVGEVDIQASLSRRHSLQTIRHKSYAPDTIEWWERIPKQPVRRNPLQGSATFEFKLPEHLPSSPMCPANEKHVGGGKGVCVYHGRRKEHQS